MYGLPMNITVDLGAAVRFASYDAVHNRFSVSATLLRRDDIAVYPIVMTASFSNATFQERYSRTFYLTVWDVADEIHPDEDWFPENPIWYPEWQPTNFIRANKTQEYDPERPQPYIVDLKADGRLIIGWDRTMSPP